VPLALIGGAIVLWSRYRLPVAGSLVTIAVLYGLVFGAPPFTQRSDDENFTSNTPLMRGTADWGRTVLPRRATADVEAPVQDPQPAIIDGQGTITSYEKQSVRTSAVVDVQTPATLDLPVYYFPGWKVWLDGEEVRPEIGAERGTMRVALPLGTHRVEARLTDTPVRSIGNTISAVSALAVTAFAVFAVIRAVRRPAGRGEGSTTTAAGS
jgi:hypothetical protein